MNNTCAELSAEKNQSEALLSIFKVEHFSFYWNKPGNIQVALFDDRLEVTSPGMLLNNVTISKMMEGYSKPRNPAIARAFAYMKIIEKWGTGIPGLFETCKEYGLP